MKNLSTRKGFTLIELLIVITIIGILAVALLPSVLGAPARARDAARKADLSNVIAAIETFNADNGHYPSGSGCISAISDGSNTNVLNAYFQGNTPPADPQGQGVLTCDTGYVYCPLGDASTGASYLVAAYMELNSSANADETTDFGAFTCGVTPTPPTTLTPSTGHMWVDVR